ncbi:hypothetical protein AYO41_03220 [Verrucomicrobia bacterium SCGC AG-212-E04]|nr:hypothetical protein AYO41_03220 [Verrucomicrobia bacterium SCGC AG-212-E04]
MNLMGLTVVLQQARGMLADGEMVPGAREGSGDGWGGLIAIVVLVVAIFVTIYAVGRQQLHWDEKSELPEGEADRETPRRPRRDRRDDSISEQAEIRGG